MLSMLSSFYDPLGLVSPFILKRRLILQELCQEGLQWDKQVSEVYVQKSEAWKGELYDLQKLSLGRCIKPSNFHKIINISLHNFCDASEIRYGQCSYLRVVVKNENIQQCHYGEREGSSKKVCIYRQARTCCCCTISDNIKHDKERVTLART